MIRATSSYNYNNYFDLSIKQFISTYLVIQFFDRPIPDSSSFQGRTDQGMRVRDNETKRDDGGRKKRKLSSYDRLTWNGFSLSYFQLQTVTTHNYCYTLSSSFFFFTSAQLGSTILRESHPVPSRKLVTERERERESKEKGERELSCER